MLDGALQIHLETQTQRDCLQYQVVHRATCPSLQPKLKEVQPIYRREVPYPDRS